MTKSAPHHKITKSSTLIMKEGTKYLLCYLNMILLFLRMELYKTEVKNIEVTDSEISMVASSEEVSSCGASDTNSRIAG